MDKEQQISLEKYVDRQVECLRVYTDARFEDMQRAVDKAEETMTKRLEGMNEFREQLQSQKSEFITRTEHNLHIQGIKEDKRANLAVVVSLLAMLLNLGFIIF